MMATPSPAASRPPLSPSRGNAPHVLTQTEAELRRPSVSTAQQATNPQACIASQRGGYKPSVTQSGGYKPSAGVQQHVVPETAGRQDGASNGSSESSELENKEALKRPLAKKGGPGLRRVQSKYGQSHTLP